MRLGCSLALLVVGCSQAPAPTAAPAVKAAVLSRPGGIPMLTGLGLKSTRPPGYEGDGADDGSQPPGDGLRSLVAASAASLEPLPSVGTHPLVCDMVGYRDQLYASFAVKLIDLDGAQIHRWDGEQWHLAFDWDRGGLAGKTHEVGGQGIARLRVIDGRLRGTDADAPRFGGFGLTNAPFEDYVFTTRADGAFGKLGADDSPPAETLVMPLAFHAFDVIRFRGAIVASGGTAAINDRSGTRYPGGLWAGKPGERLLLPVLFPGEGKKVGVVRTTFMHRFGGRLYVGFQNNGRRIRWDVGVVDVDLLSKPKPDAMKLGRITPDGGWLTRRWASGGGWLYWVGAGYRGDGRGTVLYRSRDGIGWQQVAVPEAAGPVHDVLVVGETVLVLARGGLYRGRSAGKELRLARWAKAPGGDPFAGYDTFCGAPLVAVGDQVYAGSTKGGRVFRVLGADR